MRTAWGLIFEFITRVCTHTTTSYKYNLLTGKNKHEYLLMKQFVLEFIEHTDHN